MRVNGHRSRESTGNAVGYVEAGFVTLTRAAQRSVVSAKTIRGRIAERRLPHGICPAGRRSTTPHPMANERAGDRALHLQMLPACLKGGMLEDGETCPRVE